jgi:hypothetical protein
MKRGFRKLYLKKIIVLLKCLLKRIVFITFLILMNIFLVASKLIGRRKYKINIISLSSLLKIFYRLLIRLKIKIFINSLLKSKKYMKN